jgi:hypothetical protein
MKLVAVYDSDDNASGMSTAVRMAVLKREVASIFFHNFCEFFEVFKEELK